MFPSGSFPFSSPSFLISSSSNASPPVSSSKSFAPIIDVGFSGSIWAASVPSIRKDTVTVALVPFAVVKVRGKSPICPFFFASLIASSCVSSAMLSSPAGKYSPFSCFPVTLVSCFSCSPVNGSPPLLLIRWLAPICSLLVLSMSLASRNGPK